MRLRSLGHLVITRRRVPLDTFIVRLGQQPAGVDNVENNDGNNHHSTVESNEVRLVGNQVALPALQQLDGSVDTPNVNADDRQDHRAQQRDHGAGQGLQQAALHRAADKVGGAEDEDGDREQLENDTRDHDVRAGLGVAADFAGFLRCQAAADGLDDQRDHVAGAEDP